MGEKFPRLTAIITELPDQGFRVTVHLRSSPDDEMLLTDEPVVSAEEGTLVLARLAVSHDIPTEQMLATRLMRRLEVRCINLGSGHHKGAEADARFRKPETQSYAA